MQTGNENTSNRASIGVGVAVIAVLALVGGFLLGRSGSDSDVISNAADQTPSAVTESDTSQSSSIANDPAPESGAPPEAIAEIDTANESATTPSASSDSTTSLTETTSQPSVAESDNVEHSSNDDASEPASGETPEIEGVTSSPAVATNNVSNQASAASSSSDRDSTTQTQANATSSSPTTVASSPASQPASRATTPPTTDSANRAVATTTTTAAPAPTLPPAPVQVAGQLFVDSTNSAAQWASNNSTDPRAATIASEIGSQPIARWFGDWNSNVGADVAAYVNRATAANAVPALVAYNIVNRDCGQHSSGGAANFAQYDAWISSFASGLGNSGAIVILEPDALALNGCASSERNDALASAVDTIKSTCANCTVYLDAGHSNWVAPADMANRLLAAGVLSSDGFFTNVSNYNATSNETAFGAQVLNQLGNPNGLGQVIDTSRNGNGANNEWCDAPGRAIGDDPTLQPGSSTVDAYLWVKVPGEADGCIAGAGQFVPDRAFELATG